MLVNRLKQELQTHVECYETTVLVGAKIQAERACTFLQNNDNFNKVKEFNIVGQSQGGLIGRSILENCNLTERSKANPPPKVRNLLTIGTPNMGFSEIPEGGCQHFNNANRDGLCSL